MFFAPVVRTPALHSFDRSFQRFVQDHFFTPSAATGLQMQEDDKTWTVNLDMPGVTREDLRIQVEGAIVRIETRPEATRSYKAAYELPQEIDVEATQAKLENGVLTLTLAKPAPVNQTREIKLL